MEQDMPGSSLISALNPLKSRGTISEELLLPTYQNRLRVVGRHLDLNEYRSVSLMDVEGGILVRASSPKRHAPELLEFPDEAFLEIVRTAIQSRGSRKRVKTRSELIPTGYEDFFRALGYELDRRLAKSVTLHECQESIFLAGLEKGDPTSHVFSSFDVMLGPDEIQLILDSAFRRRG
jgi:hypothetical protein